MIEQRRGFVRSLVLAAAAACLPAVLLADDKPITASEFKKAFEGPDSHQGGLAIKRLNPDQGTDYDLLKMVIDKGSWYYRGIAVSVLAKTGNPQNVKDMVDRLTDRTEAKPLVRQGMAMAIAKMNDRKLYPELMKVLNDKDNRVRRQAAFSLRIHKDKGSIEALIKRWKEEKDPRVANYIRETLEDITKHFKGPNPQDWDTWWLKVKDGFKIAETDEEAEAYAEEAKQAEEEGNKLADGTTHAKDVDLAFRSRGLGTPVIVLPHYGHSKDVMIPFFIEIEKFARCSYMDIPKIKDFKNLAKEGKTPYFPIDQLVDAFEAFRKTTKYDRIAIVACGLDSWIAMRYASKYPRNTAALILVCPYSSLAEVHKTTANLVKAGEETGDRELQHYALTRTVDTKTDEDDHDKLHRVQSIPKWEGEDEALTRKHYTIFFGDQKDSLLEQLFEIYENHPGSILYPEFKVENEAANVPVLVAYGLKSLLSSPSDCEAVAKHYGAIVVPFKESADLPFVEEPEKFSQSMRTFLAKYVDKKVKK
ncbi:HEAT repeat domain-containing protein [bacterium]|nr:HEAT repeat domain-containing protein [bacterium]